MFFYSISLCCKKYICYVLCHDFSFFFFFENFEFANFRFLEYSLVPKKQTPKFMSAKFQNVSSKLYHTVNFKLFPVKIDPGQDENE